MFDVITIGTATRDIFIKSPAAKVVNGTYCFPLGEKIEVKKMIFTTGGGATNTATTFARQGFKTAVLVKVGSDEAAKRVLENIQKEKVNPFLITERGKTTAYSVIILSPNGERTILVHRGASEDLKTSEIPFKKLKSGWIYVSPGGVSFSVIEKIFNHCFRNKVLIAFNPSRYFLEMGIKKLIPLLRMSAVVILNREEAAFLTKTDFSKEKEIFRKMDKIIHGVVVMTEGAKGVMISDGNRIYRAGVFSGVKLVDRTGAGDAFGSGFVAGLIREIRSSKLEIRNLSPRAVGYAIRLGLANASSVVEHIGAKDGIIAKSEFNNSKRWRFIKIDSWKI